MSNINIMKNGACLYKPQQPQPPNEINNQRSTSAESSSITNLAYSKLLHSHSTDTVAISHSMPLFLLSKSNPTKAFISSFLPDSSKPLLFLFPFSMSHSFTTNNSIIPKTRLRGVVFDMDGTLTVPAIDFAAMYKAVLGDHEYRRIKAENPSGVDILRQIENWAPDKQRKAYDIIADYERQGLDRLQIMPGAAELCGLLDSKKIRKGLITRNVKSAVDLFHERFGITFSPALSREFRPYKPNPAPLLHICSAWEVQPNEVIMVGDSLKDDVACGKRAGAFTCLLDQTGRYDSPEYADFDFKPDFKVTSLAEVYSILEGNFDLSR